MTCRTDVTDVHHALSGLATELRRRIDCANQNGGDIDGMPRLTVVFEAAGEPAGARPVRSPRGPRPGFGQSQLTFIHLCEEMLLFMFSPSPVPGLEKYHCDRSA